MKNEGDAVMDLFLRLSAKWNFRRARHGPYLPQSIAVKVEHCYWKENQVMHQRATHRGSPSPVDKAVVIGISRHDDREGDWGTQSPELISDFAVIMDPFSASGTPSHFPLPSECRSAIERPVQAVIKPSLSAVRPPDGNL